MKIIILALFLFIAIQGMELKKFKVTRYQVPGKHLLHPLKGVVLADLHCKQFPGQNILLIQAIKKEEPDFILIPGDFVSCKKIKGFQISIALLEAILKIAPVYYEFGNHEMRMMEDDHMYHNDFLEYLKKIEDLGVIIPDNRTAVFEKGENKVFIAGLRLPLCYYKKGKQTVLEQTDLNSLLTPSKENVYTILLAHNPVYLEEYADWGADLTLSGHNHGGLIHIPGFGSLVSPELQFHPKYDGGKYRFGERYALVSRGLGTHTFHIRILNRAELVSFQILPNKTV